MREIPNDSRIALGKPPIVWCDFNACGWSGSSEDNCYYVFGPGELEKLNPIVGMKVLLYADDNERTVVVCEASFEKYKDGWRARPVATSWRDVALAELEML